MFEKILKHNQWIGKSNFELKNMCKKFLDSKLLKSYCKDIFNWSERDEALLMNSEDFFHYIMDDDVLSFINDPKWFSTDHNIFGKEDLNINEAIIDNLTKHYVYINMLWMSAAWVFVGSNKKTIAHNSLKLFKTIKELDFMNRDSPTFKTFTVFEKEIIKSEEFKSALKNIQGLELFVRKCQFSRVFFERVVEYVKYKEKTDGDKYQIIDFFEDILLITDKNKEIHIDVSDMDVEELKEVSLSYKCLKDQIVSEDEITKEKMKELRHLLGNYTMIANFELAKRDKK